jgi:hypothetical protein
METPFVRPGLVQSPEPSDRIVARFFNSAHGNMVIQYLATVGIPGDRLGVTVPDRMPDGQGMVLSIPCSDTKLAAHIEAFCRAQGATTRRQQG